MPVLVEDHQEELSKPMRESFCTNFNIDVHWGKPKYNEGDPLLPLNDNKSTKSMGLMWACLGSAIGWWLGYDTAFARGQCSLQ